MNGRYCLLVFCVQYCSGNLYCTQVPMFSERAILAETTVSDIWALRAMLDTGIS